MRTLARNMFFLLRAIADAKAHYGLRKREALPADELHPLSAAADMEYRINRSPRGTTRGGGAHPLLPGDSAPTRRHRLGGSGPRALFGDLPGEGRATGSRRTATRHRGGTGSGRCPARRTTASCRKCTAPRPPRHGVAHRLMDAALAFARAIPAVLTETLETMRAAQRFYKIRLSPDRAPLGTTGISSSSATCARCSGGFAGNGQTMGGRTDGDDHARGSESSALSSWVFDARSRHRRSPPTARSSTCARPGVAIWVPVFSTPIRRSASGSSRATPTTA